MCSLDAYLKERKSGSEIKEMDARALQIGVQAAFAAMQAGAQVAQMPQIAPIADEVMKGAGYQRPNPMGDDPNYPMPSNAQIAPNQQVPQVHENTSPMNPPVPQHAGTGMQGIETERASDNLG